MEAAKRKSEERCRQDGKVGGEYQEYSVTRKLSARLKGKIYKCAVRPAVLYGYGDGGGDRKDGEKDGGG